MGFTPTKRSRVRLAEPRTLRVRCSDTGASWLVTYGPQRVVTNRGDGPADATAVGPASDLYLFLWNRPPSASPTVSGDHALLDLWPANLAV